MADPVVYHNGTSHPDPLYPGTLLEVDYPEGWYFYDETWSDWYGPHVTEAEARLALESYCREVLGCPEIVV